MTDLNRNLIDAWEAKGQREWLKVDAAGTGLIKPHAVFEAQIDLNYYRQWFQFWVTMYRLDNHSVIV